jgi:hypothetical protein
LKEISTTPPAAIVTRAEAPLAELARQISSAHAESLAAARTSLEHARRCGELLLQAKARLPHGQFMPWVTANCPFGLRTGQNYMRVARDWEEIQAAMRGEETDTIAGALRALTGPADPKAQRTALLDDAPAEERGPNASAVSHLDGAAAGPRRANYHSAGNLAREANAPAVGHLPDAPGGVVAARPGADEEGNETRAGGARDREVVDGLGIPVQPHALEAFADREGFDELLSSIRRTMRLFNDLAGRPGGVFLTLPGVSSYRRRGKGEDGSEEGRFVHEGLEQALQQVRAARPTYTVCPYQYAEGPHPEKCSCCKGLNWTPELGKSIPPACIKRAKGAFGVREEPMA